MTSLARGWTWNLAALVGLASMGCDGTISVTFFTGVQELELTSAAFALPSELDDGAGRIASVPCGPSGMCPPSDTVAITCEADACDPAPITLNGQVGGVIDVQMLLADTREIGVRSIESYTVEELRYEVRFNTLGLDVGPVELFWGPEAATAIDSALGVRRFGTVPVVRAGETPGGSVELDPEGAEALGEYLANTGSRVRFFARTVVDLDPGDPFPDGGSLRVGVNATITAVGRVIE